MRNKSMAILLASLMLIIGLVPFGTLAEEPHVENLDTGEQSLHPAVEGNAADLPGEDQAVDLELDGKIDSEGEVTEGEKGDLYPEEVEPDGSGDEDEKISDNPGLEGDQEAEDSEQSKLEISEEKIPEAQEAGLPDSWGVILVNPNGEIIAVGDEEANLISNIEMSKSDIPMGQLAVTLESTDVGETFALKLGAIQNIDDIQIAYFKTYHAFYKLYSLYNPDMSQYDELTMLITIHQDILNMDGMIRSSNNCTIQSNDRGPYKIKVNGSPDATNPMYGLQLINVDPGYKCTVNNLIIDGSGCDNVGIHIQANGNTTIGPNVTIRNCRGVGADGGGIQVSKDASLTIQGTKNESGNTVKFINNTALQGGAIYLYENASVSINNASFEENSSTGKHGGAIYARKSKNDLTINSCDFTNNKCTGSASYGGAITCQSSAVINNSNFTENSAPNQSGGAIFYTMNVHCKCNERGTQ